MNKHRNRPSIVCRKSSSSSSHRRPTSTSGSLLRTQSGMLVLLTFLRRRSTTPSLPCFGRVSFIPPLMNFIIVPRTHHQMDQCQARASYRALRPDRRLRPSIRSEHRCRRLGPGRRTCSVWSSSSAVAGTARYA